MSLGTAIPFVRACRATLVELASADMARTTGRPVSICRDACIFLVEHPKFVARPAELDELLAAALDAFDRTREEARRIIDERFRNALHSIWSAPGTRVDIE